MFSISIVCVPCSKGLFSAMDRRIKKSDPNNPKDMKKIQNLTKAIQKCHRRSDWPGLTR